MSALCAKIWIQWNSIHKSPLILIFKQNITFVVMNLPDELEPLQSRFVWGNLWRPEEVFYMPESTYAEIINNSNWRTETRVILIEWCEAIRNAVIIIHQMLLCVRTIKFERFTSGIFMRNHSQSIRLCEWIASVSGEIRNKKFTVFPFSRSNAHCVGDSAVLACNTCAT